VFTLTNNTLTGVVSIGLKTGPRGHLNAKDQGQGLQHDDAVVVGRMNQCSCVTGTTLMDTHGLRINPAENAQS